MFLDRLHNFYTNFIEDNDNANFYLGLLYLEGNGCMKSISNARKYLIKADKDNDNSLAKSILNIIGRG